MRILSTLAIAVVIVSAAAATFWMFGGKWSRPSEPTPAVSPRTLAAPATSVATGTAMVAGTGKAQYFVYDASGETIVTSQGTNVAVELPTGNYLINLNATGTKQPLTVREGQQATVTAGTAMVAGTGATSYLLYDASGKTLVTTGWTNAAIELFPGNYLIQLNHTEQPLTVREGQQATVMTGTAMVASTGKARYIVYNDAGNVLASAYTNDATELFPGDYVIELNNSRQPLTVREGQLTAVTAGTAMVAGTVKDRYNVYDASGKLLTAEWTNAAIDLFPGNYVIEFGGVKQPVTVRPGQQADWRGSR